MPLSSTYELLLAGLVSAIVVGTLVSGWARNLLRLRSDPMVWALAAAAAVGGALAPGVPTGLTPADVVLRAAFGLGCTLLASKARRWAWISAGALAVVGSYDEAWVVLAFVALGLAVGSAVAKRPTTGNVLGALIGACASQVFLRLSFSPHFGVSAGMAGLGLVVLAAGTLGQGYRWLGRGVLGVGVVVVAAAALAGVAVLHARVPAEQGLAEAEAGVSAAQSNDTAAAVVDLHTSARHLAQAHSNIARWWAAPGALLPVVSQNERVLSALTSQGSKVAGAAIELATASQDPSTGAAAGSVNIAKLSALGPPVDASLVAVRSANDAIVRLASPWLIPAVQSRLTTLATKVSSLKDDEVKLAAAVKVLPQLLGASGPQTYLMMVQDPSELRGGGGVIGDRAILTADHGHLSLGGFAPVTGVPTPLKVDPATAQWAKGEGVNLASFPEDDSFSPDFPADARLFEASEAQLGVPVVDGVISVDPAFLQAILGITGPVAVAGWPVPLSSTNVMGILLHDQYVALQGTARQAFLAAATSTIFNTFTHQALPGPIALARAFGPAVTSKHLLVYSNSPPVESALQVIGVGGAMPPVKGDFLEVVTESSTADKIDWFLRRAFTYHVDYNPATGATTASLTVTLTNLAPASGEPAYVIGPEPGSPAPAGTGVDFLAVYTPLNFVGGQENGRSLLVGSQVEKGRNEFSSLVEIPPGHSQTLTFDLKGKLSGAAAYHLYLADQPEVARDVGSVTVSPTPPWRVTGSSHMAVGPSAATRTGRFQSDQIMSATFTRRP